jgi:hypothetical protein
MPKQNTKTSELFIILYWTILNIQAQKKSSISITGNAGITYEGYGPNAKPPGWNVYLARRRWNQVRFNFMPTIKFSKNFSLPMNFNFAASLPILQGHFHG